MKRSSKVLYVVLMALPLAVTLIVLGFLPGQVPAHYGPDFQVDRWGSKYELLLLPGFTVLIGLLLLFFGRLAARQEGTGQNNAKVAVTAGLLCMALFNALTYYFLYTAWAQVTDLSAVPVGVEQVAFGCMGALLLVAGNLNPKLRNNSLMGLRTPWSRKNDRVWKKCQRFGGVSLMLAGAALVLAAGCSGLAAGDLWKCSACDYKRTAQGSMSAERRANKTIRCRTPAHRSESCEHTALRCPFVE